MTTQKADILAKKSDKPRRGPGRPPSDRSQAEIARDSQKKHRNKVSLEGKFPLQAPVEKQTNNDLKLLKMVMELNNVGEVIDVLVSQEKKRRKLT